MASTINITLPEPLSKFVEAQVEAGDFGTPSQYVLELILRDQVREQHLLEHLLAVTAEEEDSAIEIPEDVLERGDIVGFLEEHLQQTRP